MLIPRPDGLLSPWRCGAFAGLLGLALGAVLAVPFVPTRYQLHQGAVAPATIKSPVQAPPFISASLTRERQTLAAASVSDVLILDITVFDKQMAKAEEALRWLQQVRDAPRGGQQPAAELTPPAEVTLASQTLAKVVALSDAHWHEAHEETLNLLRQTQRDRIAPDQLPSAKAQLAQRIAPRFTPDQTSIVADLIQALLRANLAVDRSATERLRQVAADQAEPVLQTLSRGETIVRDGEIIGPLHLEKLRAAGLLNPSVSWLELAGILLLGLLVSSTLALYIYVTQPPSLSSLRRLVLVALVLVASVLAAKFALPGRPLWAMAFPVAAAVMLLTTLLQLSLGLMAATFLSLLAIYVTDFSPELLAYAPQNPLDTLERLVLYLVTGIGAALVVWRARRTSQYFVAGAVVAGLGAVVALTFWLLTADRELATLGRQLAAVVGNGLLSAGLAVGFFVLLGLVFDVTTNIQLQELARVDHPLMRRLLQEAPGTYYHSILVGNMAEQVCEAIGADALLARVGAYYHDIGKVQNPGFFIENQRRGENVHDRLDPLTSASIVMAHVTDGLRLAEEYRLPTRVRDFVREHHGTRLTTSFYNAATHLTPRVNPELFRYPGPQPGSRETGAVMLADSVEAVARSEGLEQPEELDALVDRVVAERVAEGQLSHCDLTLRDLEVCKTVFKGSLQGIFHPRVQYPAPAAERAAPEASAPAPRLRSLSSDADEEQRRTSGSGG